jgi:hypothetical protein
LSSNEQVKANSFIQMMGQVGRGIGPILSTGFYSRFIATFGKPSGFNAAVLFNMFWVIAAQLPVICNFTLVFGTFNDPSPAAQRSTKTDAVLI